MRFSEKTKMNPFISRQCPLCDEPKTKISIYPDANPEKNLDKIQNYWRGFYEKKIFFPYSRCQCGFLYCEKYFSDDFLNTLYSNMEDNIYSGDSETDHITKDMYVDEINKMIKDRGNLSVLEIGADNGTIIKKLKKYKNIIDFTAVEPNKKMHNNLSELTENVFSDLSELPKNKTFDIIVCIHVLDHIPKIDGYIKDLASLINKDGFLFGVVHDESSTLAKLLGKRWPAYCLQHPHLFNQKTINDLMQRVGLREIKVFKTTNSFKFGYLLSQLYLALLKKNIKFPSLFNIKLRLGNIGFIFRK